MSKLLRELFEWVNPLDVAKRLIELFGEPGLIWLDSDGSENGRWAILAADPIEHMTSRGLPNEPDASNPFELLRTEMDELVVGHSDVKTALLLGIISREHIYIE